MTGQIGRREFFLAALSAAGALFQQGTAKQDTTRAGQVYDPARAGRSQTPVTAADNDHSIQALEKKLRCTCGCGLDIYTCRTTDFACTYSPALHKQVLAMRSEGKTAQEVLDAFVAQYGTTMLMSPPRRGINILGYLVPSILLIAAAGLLLRVLNRWATRARTAPTTTAVPSDATPAELERLQRELDKLPG
ncbi:MAG TPA: cytochrome c-type biogenesis protein CcmH [Gemmatimonadales bacterium]|nr:cytochrome c-type biogenesis protein CcmH [Gemmatimonadales bacterium]